MKTSNSSMSKTGLGIPSLILISLTVGAGSAIAETFWQGGSTATIEQSGSGTSRSEVARYRDGQKIVTRDGNSTDVTIQESGGSLAPDYGWGYSDWGDDRFDRQRMQERFSGAAADDYVADDCPESPSSSERDAFKQRMLGRMRSRFLR